MVSDSAERSAFIIGCEWTKTKPNFSARGVGSLDLGDGIHGDALGVDHYFPNRLYLPSEDDIRPGGLACFLYITGCVYQPKSSVSILQYLSFKL